jgi:hypothetical protein
VAAKQPDQIPIVNQCFKLSKRVNVIRKNDIQSDNSSYTVSFMAQFGKGGVLSTTWAIVA